MAAIAKIMGGAFKALGKVKTGTWKAMKGAMKETKGVSMGGIMQFVQSLGLLDPILKPLSVVLKILGGFIKQEMAPLVQEFLELVSSPEVIAMIQVLAQVLSFLFKLIYAGITGVVAIFDWMLKGIEYVLNVIKGAWEAFWAFFRGVFELAIQLIKAIVEGFWAFIKWIVDAFWFVVKGFLNFFIMIINGFIWLLNLIPGVNIAPMAYLDTGGSILETGVAVVHKGETVLTREETTAMKAGKGGAGTGVRRWDVYDLKTEQSETNRLLRVIAKQNEWNEFGRD